MGILKSFFEGFKNGYKEGYDEVVQDYHNNERDNNYMDDIDEIYPDDAIVPIDAFNRPLDITQQIARDKDNKVAMRRGNILKDLGKLLAKSIIENKDLTHFTISISKDNTRMNIIPWGRIIKIPFPICNKETVQTRFIPGIMSKRCQIYKGFGGMSRLGMKWEIFICENGNINITKR